MLLSNFSVNSDQLLAQLYHLVTDRRGRHVELLRGPGQAQMAGCGLEGAQGVQRWKSALHYLDFLTINRKTSRL